MQHLVAKFDVKLPHYLIVNRAESDELSYNTRLDDFDIGLSLVPLLDRRRKSANKEHFSFLISRIIIKVSRMESLEPPPIRITEEGIKDYSPSQSYFEERLPKYKEAALAIANKTVRFFKYKLNHPLLREFNPSEDDFQNPEWFDELGQQFKHGITHLVLRAIPGLTTSPFGSKEFTDHYDSELQQALQMGVVADLREEIRSDAQTAIFEGNFRRAILEMAIACEISTKQMFFGKSTTAGTAYEYLEDSGRVNVRVTELIDGVAKQSFGESFKDIYPKDFRNIDFLFRCRNKVAHRGEDVFRDDKGIIRTVDLTMLEKWWDSMEALFLWLDKRRDSEK